MEYVPPILDGHTPFFFDVHDCQVDGLLSCQIIYELNLGFGVLSDTSVQIFNGICRVDDLSDLQREVKITGQVYLKASLLTVAPKNRGCCNIQGGKMRKIKFTETKLLAFRKPRKMSEVQQPSA